MRRLLALFILPLLLGAAPGQMVSLCDRAQVPRASDGRVLNHFPYPQAYAGDLVPAPLGLAPGGNCLVQRAMLPDLERLAAAAAADPIVAGRLRAISCYRSTGYQSSVFCRRIGRDGSSSTTERAWSSAPPGHSEHATGYVLDFGRANQAGCTDLAGCFPATPEGRWLIANAARFGLEMSFPAGSSQGVGWEPWHWRWVGKAGDPAGLYARRLFARARAFFPANPAQGEPVTALAFTSAAPAPVIAPARQETARERRARERREKRERRARRRPS